MMMPDSYFCRVFIHVPLTNPRNISNKLIEALGGRCTRPNRAPPPCWALLPVTVNCTRLCGIPGMDLTVPGGPRQRGRPSTPGSAGAGRSSPHRLRQALCRLVQGRWVPGCYQVKLGCAPRAPALLLPGH